MGSEARAVSTAAVVPSVVGEFGFPKYRPIICFDLIRLQNVHRNQHASYFVAWSDNFRRRAIDHGNVLTRAILPIAAGMKDFNQLTRVSTTTKVSVKTNASSKIVLKVNENENRPRSRTTCELRQEISRLTHFATKMIEKVATTDNRTCLVTRTFQSAA